MTNKEIEVEKIKLSVIQHYQDLIEKGWDIDKLKAMLEFDKNLINAIIQVSSIKK
jgi:hypothetical protein